MGLGSRNFTEPATNSEQRLTGYCKILLVRILITEICSAPTDSGMGACSPLLQALIIVTWWRLEKPAIHHVINDEHSGNITRDMDRFWVHWDGQVRNNFQKNELCETICWFCINDFIHIFVKIRWKSGKVQKQLSSCKIHSIWCIRFNCRYWGYTMDMRWAGGTKKNPGKEERWLERADFTLIDGVHFYSINCHQIDSHSDRKSGSVSLGN